MLNREIMLFGVLSIALAGIVFAGCGSAEKAHKVRVYDGDVLCMPMSFFETEPPTQMIEPEDYWWEEK